ncbi:MAG: TetR family transcriptional regulator, partial [Spirochaetaceae bacterium]|nr:TetR family transcriptional regulator [Spirochaetaceae bacterium]
MSNSNITKQALANAFKELMFEKSFTRITINDICSKCSLNRKSFYYHFKDKYDLLNWIFYVDFFSIHIEKEIDSEVFFLELCT